MNRHVFLILILSMVLFALFQNFTVPARVLPVEKKFESNEVDPKKRLTEFVKFEVGSEVLENIEKLKSKLKIEWGGRAPQSVSPQDAPLAQEAPQKTDPLKYSLQNFRTLRIANDSSELNCQVDGKGLNIVFEKRLSSSSSYVLEHNTEQQKSEAKFQFSW